MINILRNRRSVRQFLDKPVEPEKIDILQEALLRSPTSRNLRPWSFYIIEDKSIIEQLSQAKAHGSAFVKNAPLAVVIVGDDTVSDVWVEDCSIASIILQLQAESLDLGSCWVQIRNRQTANGGSSDAYVQNLLGLAENQHIESIIALGYPETKPAPIDKSDLDYSKIHRS